VVGLIENESQSKKNQQLTSQNTKDG